jgi:hypothetical protein
MLDQLDSTGQQLVSCVMLAHTKSMLDQLRVRIVMLGSSLLLRDQLRVRLVVLESTPMLWARFQICVLAMLDQLERTGWTFVHPVIWARTRPVLDRLPAPSAE